MPRRGSRAPRAVGPAAFLGRRGVRSPFLTAAVWVVFEAFRTRWPLGGLAWDGSAMLSAKGGEVPATPEQVEADVLAVPLAAIAAFFVFPDRMTFASQVLVMVMFALSLFASAAFAYQVTGPVLEVTDSKSIRN